jgi:hypothetical protein
MMIIIIILHIIFEANGNGWKKNAYLTISCDVRVPQCHHRRHSTSVLFTFHSYIYIYIYCTRRSLRAVNTCRHSFIYSPVVGLRGICYKNIVMPREDGWVPQSSPSSQWASREHSRSIIRVLYDPRERCAHFRFSFHHRTIWMKRVPSSAEFNFRPYQS